MQLKLNKGKVLVVDDDPSERQMARQILSKDYAVIEARCGWEAVTMAYRQRPDLILLNVALPFRDSYNVCQAIKNTMNTKAVPVVMMTTYSYEANEVLSKKIGVADHIEKPLTERKLLNALNKFLTQ